ncbi:MAG: right-handed parallel beta-helix repeat-containing protein [Verrucomicrobiota bacterium]
MKRHVLLLGLVFILPNFLAADGGGSTITVVNINDSGTGSLRAALAAASSGDTIDFDAGLDGQSILLASELSLASSVCVDASGLADGLTIDGNTSQNDRRRVLNIGPGVVVTLKSLSITGGWTADGTGTFGGGNGGNGGGVLIGDSAEVTMVACAVQDCRTGDGGDAGVRSSGGLGGHGGGIYLGEDAELSLKACSISGNTTGIGGAAGISGNGGSGSGIYVEKNAEITMNSCAISDNQTGDGGAGAETGFGGEGGGIFLECDTLATMTACTISGNRCGIKPLSAEPARGLGSGIVTSGTLQMTGCTLNGNQNGRFSCVYLMGS